MLWTYEKKNWRWNKKYWSDFYWRRTTVFKLPKKNEKKNLKNFKYKFKPNKYKRKLSVCIDDIIENIDSKNIDLPKGVIRTYLYNP